MSCIQTKNSLYLNHIIFFSQQTHYASEEDPSFLLEDEDLGDDDDDDEVTGLVLNLTMFVFFGLHY